MFKKKDRRPEERVNAGSMADIAFLLLIFFLVTATILTDTGIQVKLPPYVEVPPARVADRNLFVVQLNSRDGLFIEDGPANLSQARRRAKEFIMNPGRLPNMPASPRKAVISLTHDRGTSYQAYIEVYNELMGAYRELWDESARRQYRRPYKELPKALQKKVRADIPMVISEAEPVDLMAGE